jgi:hypothetical protein
LKPPGAPVLNSSMKVLFWIQSLIQFFVATG